MWMFILKCRCLTTLVQRTDEFHLLCRSYRQPLTRNVSLHSYKMTNELLQAIENDDVQKVREILTAGTDVNFINDDDEFPLKTACWRGNKVIVELLIESGAEVNLADDSEFYTPLMAASRHGHAEIVQLLIKHGVDVNAQDDYDNTSLTRAAESGHLEVVRLLLENGANPNLRDEFDETPLELAEENGHFEVAEFIRRTEKSTA
jgi:ankyrin repeat protein